MSGKLTLRQLRAIAAYADAMGLIPQLSAVPIMRFKNYKGEFVEVNMINILAFYDQSKRKGKKEK